ncbi:helix-turn-helix domain-containing protein [Streptomyces sp. NPDC020898]|uniref:helix-turn-helix domain-containing protein n=1 Tax=Streptomyces sp. NPDC020898 TaxID=3365101 RepID=UPI00379DF2AA
MTARTPRLWRGRPGPVRPYPAVRGSWECQGQSPQPIRIQDWGMDGTNALGDCLRARRALVRPQDAGIRGGGLRHVPGLRREEVAMLAGISADYYLRLEQGRDRNPSLQVLEALADVLNPDPDATTHRSPLPRRAPPEIAAQAVPRTVRGPRRTPNPYHPASSSSSTAGRATPPTSRTSSPMCSPPTPSRQPCPRTRVNGSCSGTGRS